MRAGLKQGARRPVLIPHEPREGRQASPSNPTNGRPARASSEADAKRRAKPEGYGACVVFRCSEREKAFLLAKAERASMRISDLMREALGLVDARRRRPLPKADPALIREVGRIGGNLNQIARWLNSATAAGLAREIDALAVAAELVAIERALRPFSPARHRNRISQHADRVLSQRPGRRRGPVGDLVASEVVAYADNRDILRDEKGATIMRTREPLPEVLRGAPERTEALIDATPHKWTYRAGVVSFAPEDAPSEHQQALAMDASKSWPSRGLNRTSATFSGFATPTRAASSCIS